MQAGKHTSETQLGGECIEIEANDMWEWDVTRDGRATARKDNVGEQTGLLLVPLGVRGLSCTHRAGWPRDCSMLPRRGAL